MELGGDGWSWVELGGGRWDSVELGTRFSNNKKSIPLSSQLRKLKCIEKVVEKYQDGS